MHKNNIKTYIQPAGKRTTVGRLLLAAVAVFAVLCAAGCSVSPAATTAADPNEAEIIKMYPLLASKPHTTEQVERIIDGDTFVTKSGFKVRLIGVNTPEVKGASRPLGLLASAYTSNKLEGKTIVLFADAGDKDKYGRLLRYVFVAGEKIMFNEAIMRDGYASVMTIPPNVLFAERFKELEREARTSGAGLWAENGEMKAEQPEKPQAADSSQESAVKSTDSPAACQDPKIKGNIRGSSKIYHTPESSSYEQTKAERMFCTEDEAKAAGFRKAGR